VDFEALRDLLRRVDEEVESEIELVEKKLAKKRGGAGELAVVKDILYKDKWFRIATTVFTQVKKQFAEGAETGKVIEAAEKRQFDLRLEVVEAPLLKIEAAVEQDGSRG
jgi:hypothetical protein